MKYEILREENIGNESSSGNFVSINNLKKSKIIIKKDKDEKIFIERITNRARVRNLVDQFEKIEDGTAIITKLTEEIANKIVDSIVFGNKEWSDAFLISDEDFESKELDWTKTEQEHKYTSTGIKFWRHQASMESYRDDTGKSVISTHISPEGACNLKCPYCSVTYRDTHSRIELDRIKNYILQLKQRGLKAAIVSGGGEPTLYKQFNELIQWLKYEQDLSIGLITNGTQFKKFEEKTWGCFDWIRVSLNLFDGWEDKIGSDFRSDLLDPECVIGCSMVYTVEHESTDEATDDRVELFKKVSCVADKIGAKYVRLLPNCLLEQKQLLLEHQNLQELLKEVDDERFFQQYKIHGAPKTDTCHQSYFRPYLSEEPWHEDGEPGSVYPCDSVVLNDSVAHFDKLYQLCKPENIGDFMDKKIQMKFDPRKSCHGCVFTDNVNMLDDWKENGTNHFDDFQEEMKHENFI